MQTAANTYTLILTSPRADLHKCLSTKRANRKPRGRSTSRGVYSSGEEFTISDRPPEVTDRAVPGHWEST